MLDVLISGGAGFVGSSLAISLAQHHPDWRIVALDNLRRRGSELCLSRLRAAGVQFVHGDVRMADDLRQIVDCDLLLECSAEPSVLAGLDGGSPAYVLQTNLSGTINCLEYARERNAAMIFLSSSRVYPIGPLSELALRECDTRFEIDHENCTQAGISARGISEAFTTSGARSIYGATKLCSELLIEEYVAAYGMNAVINRCGLLTGPWQMGKVDQGVVMHWVASHFLGKPLAYIGYGGTGKQVRDILHVDDLASLVDTQINAIEQEHGSTYNVGGGRDCSVSLQELTAHCVQAVGRSVPITGKPETRVADIPLYLSDTARAAQRFSWRPEKTVEQTITEIARWVQDNRDALTKALQL